MSDVLSVAEQLGLALMKVSAAREQVKKGESVLASMRRRYAEYEERATRIISPFVSASIEKYNEHIGSLRVNPQASVCLLDVDGTVSVWIDLLYPAFDEREKNFTWMTPKEEDTIVAFLRPDLERRLKEAGLTVRVISIGYDWNM